MTRLKNINLIDNKTPYRWQRQVLRNLRNYNVIVAPRQCGKTELVTEMIRDLVNDPSISYPVINLCSDKITRLKKIYKDRFQTLFSTEFPDYEWPRGEKIDIQCKRKNGDHFTINLFGATHSPDGPRGTTSHFNIIEEAGEVSKKFVMDVVMPTTDKTEGPTIVTGTVKPNDYYDIFLRARKEMNKTNSPWYVFLFQLGDKWTDDIHTKKAMNLIKARYDMNNPEERATFEREDLCHWHAGLEASPFNENYFLAYKNDRIGNYPINMNYPVGTAWDDGLGCTAVWFWQIINTVPRFVDFKIWFDQDFTTICEDVKTWYRDKQVIWGTHIFPHTCRSRNQINKSPKFRIILELLNNRGRYVLNPVVKDIEDKILVSKKVMNASLFDENYASLGIRSLQLYRRKHNPKSRSKGFIKDKWSHGAEAFGEFAIAYNNGRLSYAGFPMDLYEYEGLLKSNKDSILKPY